MKYLSLFSGIEAASVAWHPLGWSPVAFSEIDSFPCAVLKDRFPTVPNWGNITKFKEWPDACICDSGEHDRPRGHGKMQREGMVGRGSELHIGSDGPPRDSDLLSDSERGSKHNTYGTTESVCTTCGGIRIDLIVGGSPCQAFSIAGLRKGLDDPRGNLMLTYLAVVAKYRPRWVLWENVPGVLSSNNGRDFGTFLGGLGECGYGYAYRVLDTQFVRTREFPFAIPQRRRRVFVVGHLGEWRRAAAVLFDAESLSGNTPPRRKAGQRVTGTLKGGSGERGRSDPSDGNGGGLICASEAETLLATDYKGPGHNRDHNFVATYRIDSEASNSMKSGNPHSGFVECDVSKTIDTGGTDPNKAQGGNVVLTVFENHPQDSRITETDGVGPTVHSKYGTGGGNVPLVLEGKSHWSGGPHPTLNQSNNTGGIGLSDQELFAQQGAGLVAARMVAFGEYEDDGTASTMKSRDYKDATDLVAHTLRGEGFDASEDGTGRGTPLVIGFSAKDHGGDAGEAAPTLRAMPHDGSHANGGEQIAVAFQQNTRDEVRLFGGDGQSVGALSAELGMKQQNYLAVSSKDSGGEGLGSAVRRLTPVECERLQGFPDGWTQIPWNRKPASECPDGRRYKSLGNSMSTNVMGWIGERIEWVEEILRPDE